MKQAERERMAGRMAEEICSRLWDLKMLVDEGDWPIVETGRVLGQLSAAAAVIGEACDSLSIKRPEVISEI